MIYIKGHRVKRIDEVPGTGIGIYECWYCGAMNTSYALRLKPECDIDHDEYDELIEGL